MKKVILPILSLTFLTIFSERVINEGKTKIIRSCDDGKCVIIESKDAITAGDGLTRRDTMHGKSRMATDTTCNVFELLKQYDVPVAYCRKCGPTRFMAPKCDMIEYEVIVRREAHGSYLKRNPHLKKGHVFPQLKVEFFLKTSDCNWRGITIPKDDPFIQFNDNGTASLFLPHKPLWEQDAFMTLDDYPLKDTPEYFDQMSTIARKTFLILEKAWQQLDRRLVDFKVEFGFDQDGNLLLADVIDNDSWRVLQNDTYIDKQAFRDGQDLDEVTKKYMLVRDLTAQFTAPRQRIIVWRASERDDIAPFLKALEPYTRCGVELITVTQSLHKQPVLAYQELNKLVQETPQCVVLAYVGRSNGAGPTLSASTSTPVITVPAGFKSFTHDVWSSLRTPSDTPVMTVLEPENAVLAAAEILALYNPGLHAILRLKQETKLLNITEA